MIQQLPKGLSPSPTLATSLDCPSIASNSAAESNGVYAFSRERQPIVPKRLFPIRGPGKSRGAVHPPPLNKHLAVPIRSLQPAS